MEFHAIQAKVKKYENALAFLLDVVWSSVRGIDGILPTNEFLEKLEGDISLARQAWLGAGLNIKSHPKAHLTFNGHLFDQVKRFDGLVDEGEDWIERLHQTWK